MVLLEVCVDSLDRLRAAEAKGAGRIELCSRLDLGGLSPSRELLKAALASTRLPIHVMVRLRPGTFVCTAAEVDLMAAEIAGLEHAGVAGIVLGLLTPEGAVDVEATRRLAAAARPMAVTFHRAFDEVRDQGAALEQLLALGIDRILTSGGARDAHAGRAAIRALVDRAAGRIVVMAGGGVRPHNAAAILAETGVRELHGSVPFEVPESNPAPGGKLPGRSG